MVTRRCNMQCGHCSVESTPRLAHQPDPEVLLSRVRAAAEAGVRSLLLTGGEPMLREKLVFQVLELGRQLRLAISMTSNGFWGKQAATKVPALKKAGLTSLNLSFDRYHHQFQGPQPLREIAVAAHAALLPCSIVFTHTKEQDDLEELVAPFRLLPGLTFRFYDVQPVGAARQIDPATLSGRLDGFCNACQYPALTDDGRLTACNGPGYFSPRHSPLQVGALEEEAFDVLLDRHAQDPVLETIRTQGPAHLLKLLGDCPDFRPKTAYAGMCDLCTDICSQPEAVSYLKGRLQDPLEVAHRVALARVIRGARRDRLSREQINGPGLGRVLLALLDGRRDPDEDQLLSRADLDWERARQVMAGSGLAQALVRVLPAAAPDFVRQSLDLEAQRQALRHLLIRDALGRIEENLQRLGFSAILLKGAAQLACGGPRVGGDIDLFLPPEQGPLLHRALKGQGWQEHPGAARHHLTPLTWRGLPLEIHTRIMPEFWGFPEDNLGTLATPWPHLLRLDREHYALHALVHNTKHLFEHGFRTAFDLQWNGPLEAARFQQLVARLRLPLAAWAPLAFLQTLLALPPVPVPPTRQLERLAAAQFFRPARAERNLFLRLPLYVWLQPNLWQALRSLLYLGHGPSPDARPNPSSLSQDLLDAAQAMRRAYRQRAPKSAGPG